MNKETTVLILLLLLMSVTAGFFIGKNDCTPCTESQIVTTIRDTVTVPRYVEMTWHPTTPKKNQSADIKNTDHAQDTTVIIDSVKTNGVGLRFEHLLANNAIVWSQYKVEYPQQTIRIDTKTVTTIAPRKNAFAVGLALSVPTRPDQHFDLMPSIGYRYEKISISAGYLIVDKSLFLGVMREF